jgi:hypothetical protein
MDCLTGLPAEVKVNILSHLDHRSLVRVAQVNKEFNLLVWTRVACWLDITQTVTCGVACRVDYHSYGSVYSSTVMACDHRLRMHWSASSGSISSSATKSNGNVEKPSRGLILGQFER